MDRTCNVHLAVTRRQLKRFLRFLPLVFPLSFKEIGGRERAGISPRRRAGAVELGCTHDLTCLRACESVD